MKKEYKLKSFMQLNAWKAAHSVAINVYKVTDKFPDSEKYSLTQQLRRAAVSAPSNIAEGFNRNSKADKKQFYYVAVSSITEVQAQSLLAKDLGYLKDPDFTNLAEKLQTAQKIIYGLIKSVSD